MQQRPKPRGPGAELERLRARVAELERLEAERERSEERLRATAGQLAAVTEAMAAFLQTGGWQEASARLLATALSQTDSEYGFIGVVVEGPTLRILAHQGIRWDAQVGRELYDTALRDYERRGYLEFTSFDNLFGRVVTGGEAVIANDPADDPRSGGLPPGHPPLRHFLGVPIFRGREVVGLIGIANRQGGYTGSEQDKIEILCRAVGVLYESYRQRRREESLERQRAEAEEALRRSDSALRQSQKLDAVGKLAGGVAHDFNNLLTVITGYAQQLVDALDGDPHRQGAREIARAADQATSLTRQLLAFSRQQTLQPSVLDLNGLVLDMENMLRRLIRENIEIELVLEPGLGPVRVDPVQIQQVILNLVVNASDAMPRGGRLTLGTAAAEVPDGDAEGHPGLSPGPYVMLTVSDSGCGMDTDTQDRIFEPFFSTKDPASRTGLGLSTVYGIVAQSGGAIAVRSRPGAGATFTTWLPQVARDAASAEVAPEPAGDAHGSECILLVEDEDAVRILIHEGLERRGYRVLAAGRPSEALEIAERHEGPIDLVLTDVVMPEMSGRELAEQVVRRRPEANVLYISGYTSEALGRHGVLEPGLELVQKPFAVSTLARRVRQILDRGEHESRPAHPARHIRL